MATYKTNFLSNVIFRIDFDQVEFGKLEEFTNKIKADFPILEIEAGEEGLLSFDFASKEMKQNLTPIKVWTLYDGEKKKKIKIHPRYFIIEYGKYNNSQELLSDVKIGAEFIKEFGVRTINRAGLRYINEINVDDKEFLKWDDYIDEDLIGSLKFIEKNSKKAARSMTNIVVKENFGDINVNYGLWNSNFPNEINEKIFILDFDGYSKFPLDAESLDVEKLVKEYNQSIEDLFELIIKDGLRGILNA